MASSFKKDRSKIIVRESGSQNWTIEGGKLDLAFKVFLRPYFLRIRMFAINILLVGVLFGAIWGLTLFFSKEGTKKCYS